MGQPRAYRNVEDAAGPARYAFAITPSDSADLTVWARALWVGGAGNVSVILWDDTVPVTISGVAAGTMLPMCVKQVRVTNTTATLIIGLA